MDFVPFAHSFRHIGLVTESFHLFWAPVLFCFLSPPFPSFFLCVNHCAGPFPFGSRRCKTFFSPFWSFPCFVSPYVPRQALVFPHSFFPFSFFVGFCPLLFLTFTSAQGTDCDCKPMVACPPRPPSCFPSPHAHTPPPTRHHTPIFVAPSNNCLLLWPWSVLFSFFQFVSISFQRRLTFSVW